MIPLATTTITISRPGDGDPYDTQTWTEVASGVRAVIGSPSGAENRDGGARSDVVARLNCDPVDLQPRDRVTDSLGNVWGVEWAESRGALIPHVVADLTRYTGVARG